MTPSEDYLLISGIQHFMFCVHQWGLIHIEDVWQENSLTYEGKMLHERADNPELKESRGSVYFSRSVAVVSHALKMQGVIDVIEFTKDRGGIYVEEKGDFYFPRILEYKRGQPKEGLEDKVQLCALAMSFEEMKNIKLDYGYLYYFSINRRLKVDFDNALRDQVKNLSEQMHYYFDNNITPKPEKNKG
jgi:CRISPR-associated exonuclease Cas4